MQQRASWKWILATAAILLYALGPVAFIVLMSFKSDADVTSGRLFPRAWGLGNYDTVFKSDLFIRALINSIGISLIATFFAVIIATLAA